MSNQGGFLRRAVACALTVMGCGEIGTSAMADAAPGRPPSDAAVDAARPPVTDMSPVRDARSDVMHDAGAERTPDALPDAAPGPDLPELRLPDALSDATSGAPPDVSADAARVAPDAVVPLPDAAGDASPPAPDALGPPVPDAAPPAPDALLLPAQGCAFVDLPLPACSVPTGPVTYRINATEVVGTSDDTAPEGLVRAINAVAEQTGVMAALIAFDPVGAMPPSVRLTAAPGGEVHVTRSDDPNNTLDATCPGQCDVCTCATAACRRAESCVQIVGDVAVDDVDPSAEPFNVSANGWSNQPFRAAIARRRGLPGDFPLLGGEERVRVDTTDDGRLRVTAPPGATLSLSGDPATLAALGLGEPRVAVCPGDCGPCGDICGDGVCTPTEDVADCPADCRPDPFDAPCVAAIGALPVAGGALNLDAPWVPGADFLMVDGLWVTGAVLVQPGDADGAFRRHAGRGATNVVFERSPAGVLALRGRAGLVPAVAMSPNVAAVLGFPALENALAPTSPADCAPCGDYVCDAGETAENCPADCRGPTTGRRCVVQRGALPVSAGVAMLGADFGLQGDWFGPTPPVVVAAGDATGDLRTAIISLGTGIWARLDPLGHLEVITEQWEPDLTVPFEARTPEARAILGFGEASPPVAPIECPVQTPQHQCPRVLASADIRGGALDAVNRLSVNGVEVGPLAVLPGDTDGALVAALRALRPRTGVDVEPLPDGRRLLIARGADRIDVATAGLGGAVSGFAEVVATSDERAGLCGSSPLPEPGNGCSGTCAGAPIAGGRLDGTNYIMVNGEALVGLDVQPCDHDYALRDALERLAPATGVHARREFGCHLALYAEPGVGIDVFTSTALAQIVSGLYDVRAYCPVLGSCGVCSP
jgi:hypothetical protein